MEQTYDRSPLYGDGLMLEEPDGSQTPLPSVDVPIVLKRLQVGLAAIGMPTRIATDQPWQESGFSRQLPAPSGATSGMFPLARSPRSVPAGRARSPWTEMAAASARGYALFRDGALPVHGRGHDCLWVPAGAVLLPDT